MTLINDNMLDEMLVTRVAWHYYSENMTQQDIANKLGISRLKVVKLVEEARKSGIVQFNFWPNTKKRMTVESELCSKYKLEDVYVIPTPQYKSDLNELIAKATATYIYNRMPKDGYINIGYGDTTGKVLNNLATMTEHPLTYISLTGGVNYYLPDTRSNIFNAKLHLIPAPLLTSSAEMTKALKNEESIKNVYKMLKISQLSVLGIGGMNEDATIVKSGIVSKEDFTLLNRKGAVGDVLCHFIDQDGNIVDADIDNRLISTPLTTIKELNNVIGVAAGETKVSAIKAVLKISLLDILITDEETAVALLED